MTAASSSKHVLVVRGGWDGHQPIEATDLFLPFLEENGYTVDVHDSPRIYADPSAMAQVDLVMQCNTMNVIEKDEIASLRAAIEAGTGIAGWHGGIADSYRNEADYLQLIGGQFANHPAIHESERTGEQSDYYIPYRVEISPAGRNHEITKGIDDFDLVSEQYWVLSDEYNDVLATTTLTPRPWDQWNRPITSPVVWTRRWGKGRVFVSTAGHRVDILENPNVRSIVERGLLWASR